MIHFSSRGTWQPRRIFFRSLPPVGFTSSIPRTSIALAPQALSLQFFCFFLQACDPCAALSAFLPTRLRLRLCSRFTLTMNTNTLHYRIFMSRHPFVPKCFNRRDCHRVRVVRVASLFPRFLCVPSWTRCVRPSLVLFPWSMCVQGLHIHCSTSTIKNATLKSA